MPTRTAVIDGSTTAELDDDELIEAVGPTGRDIRVQRQTPRPPVDDAVTRRGRPFQGACPHRRPSGTTQVSPAPRARRLFAPDGGVFAGEPGAQVIDEDRSE